MRRISSAPELALMVHRKRIIPPPSSSSPEVTIPPPFGDTIVTDCVNAGEGCFVEAMSAHDLLPGADSSLVSLTISHLLRPETATSDIQEVLVKLCVRLWVTFWMKFVLSFMEMHALPLSSVHTILPHITGVVS